MSETTPRPEFVTDEMLDYLDELRESGETNMFGAAPYVHEVFGCGKRTARAVLSYWMATFSERHASAA
jgi:hypothetical protein